MIPDLSQNLSLRELYQKIESLHAHLVQTKKIDSSGNCLDPDSLKQLENLTPLQKKAIEDLYSLVFIVKGQDGKSYCRITVRQIVNQIKEIVAQMPGVELRDIVLIGSAANAVLESDPAYVRSIGTTLDPEAPVDGICFRPLEVNDFDIRVYLKGANPEKRFEISNRLIAYYLSLAKKQYTLNLAKITAEKYLECQKDQIIRFVKDKYKKRSHPWKLAENIYSEFVPKIKNRVVASLIRYFRGEVQFPPALRETIERCAQIALTSTVFDKLSNVQRESQFLIQSFSKFEMLLVESLERECILSADGTQVGLISGKFVLDLRIRKQALVDRLLRRIRCVNSIILTIDFLKCMDYQRQGLVPVKGHTLSLMGVFCKNLRAEIPEVVKYVESHLKNNSLKTLVLLFNCCSELEKGGYSEERRVLVDSLKELIKGPFPRSWNQFLLNLLNEQTLMWKEIEAIVQVVGALYKRKQLPKNVYCELFIRESLQESWLTIAIRAKKTAFQYISLSWKLRESLEILMGMIFKNRGLPKQFKELYSLLIQGEPDPKAVFLEFLREIEILQGTPEHLKLWIKALQSRLGPQASEEAERQNVFQSFSTHLSQLWPHAPVVTKSKHCIKLLNEKKGIEAWELIERTLSNNREEGIRLLKVVTDYLISQEEHFHEYFWNLSQIVSKLSHLNDLKTFVKLLERLVLLSKIHQTLIPQAQICFEQFVKTQSEVFVEEAIPISKLIVQLFADTPTLPKYLADLLRKKIPQMFEVFRSKNDIYLFDFIQWCSKHSSVMGLDLSNVKCMLWSYGMKFKAGSPIGNNAIVLLNRIFSKIPDLAQKIDNDRINAFWTDLRFFYLQCLHREQFVLANALLVAFPSNSATTRELNEVFLQYLQSLNYEKFLKVTLLNALPSCAKSDQKYQQYFRVFLEDNIRKLEFDTILKFLEIVPKVSPSFWNVLLTRLQVERANYTTVKKMHTFWFQLCGEKDFWINDLEVWTECLICAHNLETSVLEAPSKGYENQFQNLPILSKTKRFTELVALYLKITLSRKRSEVNAQIASQLRSLVEDQSTEEWIDIDTSLCELYCPYASHFEQAFKLLERLFSLNTDSRHRAIQESSFSAMFVDAMSNSDEKLQRLSVLRSKARESTHWSGFAPGILNLNSSKVEHRPLILEQIILLAKNMKRLKEINLEVLSKIIYQSFQTGSEFTIPSEELHKILDSKACRSSEHFTPCYLWLIEQPKFKELSDSGYISGVSRFPIGVRLSDQVFVEVVKRIIEVIKKVNISEYQDIIENYCSMVLDIIDTKRQVTLLKTPTQRYYSLRIPKGDSLGDGPLFIVKLNYALLPEMVKVALAESELSRRHTLCNLTLETVGPTMSFSSQEKFLPYLESCIYMIRPCHGNFFIGHCTGTSLKFLSLAKFEPASIASWRLKFFEYLFYLGTDCLLQSFHSGITCTPNEKLKCIMTVIQKISQDKDIVTFEKVVQLLAITDTIFKQTTDHIYEFAKVIIPYLFSIAHLPLKLSKENATPLDKIAILIDDRNVCELTDFNDQDKEQNTLLLESCHKLCSSHPNLTQNGELFLIKTLKFMRVILPKLYGKYSPEFTEYLSVHWVSLIIETVKKTDHKIDEKLVFEIFCSVSANSDEEQRRRAKFVIFFLRCLLINKDRKSLEFAGGISAIAVIEKTFFTQELFNLAADVFHEKETVAVIFDPRES